MAAPCVQRPAPTASDVTDLVKAHLALASHLTRDCAASLPLHVNVDDLRSAALMALVVSAQKFEPERGIPFAHFAAIRIRGALKDELRGMDWATRTVRSRSREAESVREHLTATLDRNPTDSEIAHLMQVTVSELNAINVDVARARIVSLQGLAEAVDYAAPTDPGDSPESVLLRRERIGYLHDAIAELPVRLRIVITGYFFDGRQMNDIATELGVTQSRVSQLCAEGLSLVREALDFHLEGTVTTGRPTTARRNSRRTAYFDAVANRSTTNARLARSTVSGELLPLVAADRAARIA